MLYLHPFFPPVSTNLGIPRHPNATSASLRAVPARRASWRSRCRNSSAWGPFGLGKIHLLNFLCNQFLGPQWIETNRDPPFWCVQAAFPGVSVGQYLEAAWSVRWNWDAVPARTALHPDSPAGRWALDEDKIPKSVKPGFVQSITWGWKVNPHWPQVLTPWHSPVWDNQSFKLLNVPRYLRVLTSSFYILYIDR